MTVFFVMKNKSKKFEHIFEDGDCVSIWKYDLSKFPHGPISVEHKWKASYLKELEIRIRRGR